MTDIAGDLETHIKGLRRFAIALTGDPGEADDLVQETLKRALTYAPSGRKVRDLRAYLFTILHNVRMDSVIKAGKAGTVVSLSDATIQIPYLPSQEVRIQYRELANAMHQLPDEQREVILLVALEGLSYQGAADVLGIPIGTVMSRLNRGRAALKRKLQVFEGHPRLRTQASGVCRRIAV